MPKFIVRVVLHGARDPEDYIEFHEVMKARQYLRTIVGADGVRYELPPATYTAKGNNWTKKDIRDEVRELADSTGLKNAVFVTESVGSVWIGLDQVRD